MRYRALALILKLAVITTAGCGYHLCGTTTILPTKMKTIMIDSYDPYGFLTRALRTELRLNNIMLIQNTKDKNTILPLLKIINASKNQVTTSLFQNGKTAEYRITLNIQAQVLIPGKDYYPIDVRVCRLLFNHLLTALAKDEERDIIYQELCQQASQQLVRKLMITHILEESETILDVQVKKQKIRHTSRSVS